MKFLKGIGWFFIPYIMLPFQWKKIGKIGKTIGTVWTLFSLLMALGWHSNPQPSTATTSAPAKQETPKLNDQAKQNADAAAKLKADQDAKFKEEADKKAKEEAEAKGKADAEAKVKAESDSLTPDSIKTTVVKALGSDKTNNDKNKVVDVKSNDDINDGAPQGSKIILLTLNGNENLTESMTKKGLWMDSIPVMKTLFQNPKVYDVVISWQLPMVDPYGNTKDEVVMKTRLNKPVSAKINWDNFLFENIPQVSEESGLYWEHPALRKVDTN